jgi:hypothetical protein
MDLAVKTTASPAEIWVIVIVAVICMAYWLTMVVGIAPRAAARRREVRQAMDVPADQGATQTRDDLASVPGPRQPAAPGTDARVAGPGVPWLTRMPSQRESASDEAAPSRGPDR